MACSKSKKSSDVKTIKKYIKWLVVNFPRLKFKTHVPLTEILKAPEPPVLKRFWEHHWAHADIVVYRHGKPICILEPGGYQHVTDKKQTLRDRKKFLVCENSNVSMLSLMNSTLECMEMPGFKRMLKCFFYGDPVRTRRMERETILKGKMHELLNSHNDR